MKFIRSPFALLVSLALSVLVTVYAPTLGEKMEIPAGIYLSLLQMCVLPIVITAVVKSCYIVTASKDIKYKKEIFFYLSFIFFVIGLGIAIAFILPTGRFMADSGKIKDFLNSDYGVQPILTTLDLPLINKETIGDLLRKVFTSNIFESLNKSLIAQVICFSIFVGIAAGRLKEEQGKLFVDLISVIENIFKRIIGWVMAILPIGMFFNFSYSFQKISGNIINLLFPLLIQAIMGKILIMATLHWYAARKLKITYFQLFSHLKASLLISLSTSSTFAALPTYLNALIHEVKLDEKLVSLFAPLGIATCRYGNALYFAFIASSMGQLFSVPIGAYEILIIGLMSFIASLSSFSTGIINIGLLSVILAPVGIPSALAISLFAIIDPLIDPIRTAFTVHINSFCTIVNLAGKSSKK